jgi:hypothetical protein
MTAAFLMLALFYLSSVFYFRARLKSKANREAELKKDLAPMISKFLFYTEEDPLEARREYVQLKIEIRQLLKNGLTRTVLSEVLRDLKKDVSGSARNELLRLYSDLGLQEDAIQRLKSRRWQVLSKAILELTEMEVRGAYGLIKKFVNHRSSIVRKQAQMATVSLKNEGITYFLDSNRYHISEWQQLKLLDVIRQLDGFEAPKFKNWLTSKNAYVVLFALRLIKYYKQNDASKAIITLLNHRNQQIKVEAIQCIREFFIQDAKEPLKVAFANGNEEVKLLILDTLGLIGNIDDIKFLQNIVNKGTTHIISSKASSVINTLKPETILPESDIEPIEELTSTPTVDKPEKMEEKEKEALSVHLPKPDFKENPMAWEDVLNPEFEDEVIFNHCCLQEFRELIQEIGEPLLQTGDPGTLPLDFLPLIVEEQGAQKTTEPQDTAEETIDTSMGFKSGLDQRLHAEERITREIEALLSMENEDTPQFHEEEDVFNLNFLPILVDEAGNPSVKDDKEELDLRSIEVIAETLMQKVPKAFTKANRASENYSIQVPPEESFEAVKSINWASIASQNLQLTLDQEEDTQLKNTSIKRDDPYGFSIFQELFRTADTESKIILLDEVLAIGDEKELFFLKTLSEDPSTQVRNKASQIHDALASSLLQQEESEVGETEIAGPSIEIDSANEDTLFDLSFEPEADCFQEPNIQEEREKEERTNPELEVSNSAGNLMGRFAVLTHKIFGKIYG